LDVINSGRYSSWNRNQPYAWLFALICWSRIRRNFSMPQMPAGAQSCRHFCGYFNYGLKTDFAWPAV
jgi:hypothetical protein